MGSRLKKTVAIFITACIFAGFFATNSVFANDVLESEPFLETFSNAAVAYDSAGLPKVDAGSAIVMDYESGRVLFEKNAYTKRPMASTTKIMTAIIAIEKCNLQDEVTISKRAASIHGSNVGFKAGQKYKMIEVLYGLMLNSGNDAAIAIAEHISGTVEKFAEEMNRKAMEIGAQKTSFKSPHGLDMDGHFSTAYDLAIITRYALKNKVFSSIVKTKSITISGHDLHNTNEMLNIYPGADGVKTGYTGKAGRCLVTSATRNGLRLISVVLGCATRYKRAQASKTILDYAFSSYTTYTLLREGDVIGKIPVHRGVEKFVPVKAAENVRIPLTQTEAGQIKMKIYLPDSLPAPVYAGIDVGTARFIVNGNVIAETKLKTWSDVRQKWFLDYIEDIFGIWMRMMREGIFLKP